MILAAVFSVLFISCDNTEAPVQDKYVSSDSLVINNTFYMVSYEHNRTFLKPWNKTATILKATFDNSILVAQTTLGDGGTFSLSLPGKMNEFYFTNYFQNLGISYISDSKLKTTQFMDMYIEYQDLLSTVQLKSYVYKLEQNTVANEIKLIYADRSAEVKGTNGTITYNLSLKKGWNYVEIVPDNLNGTETYRSITLKLDKTDTVFFTTSN